MSLARTRSNGNEMSLAGTRNIGKTKNQQQPTNLSAEALAKADN
jgi:hypothetical protein